MGGEGLKEFADEARRMDEGEDMLASIPLEAGDLERA